jgi:hypothetical protein
METKRCNECQEDKPVEAFEVYRKGPSGTPYRRGSCRTCRQPERTEKEAARRGRQREQNPEGFKAAKASEATARRKRLRLEQLADVVRLVSAQLADGRSVEDVAEVLLAADVRVYGDVSADQRVHP